MIVLVAAGIIILFASYLKDQVLVPIKDKILGTSAQLAISNVEGVFSILDQFFFFSAIGLGIASVLLAYITPARPAFLFLAVLLFAIALLVIPSFGDIYQNILDKPQFTTYTSDYPMMTTIFQNYGLFLWIFGFMIVIILFARVRGYGSEGI